MNCAALPPLRTPHYALRTQEKLSLRQRGESFYGFRKGGNHYEQHLQSHLVESKELLRGSVRNRTVPHQVRFGQHRKNRGVTRKTLLALGTACAIVCGGFVNVGAADSTVIVDDKTGTEQTIYTKDGADGAFASKNDVNEAIKTAVDAEANARDTAIKKAVDDEKAAREAKDTELEGKINKNATDIKANADAIAKEKSDREAKDTELDEKITATNSNLAQEIKDREAADTALNTRIDAEAKAREDADKALRDRTTNLEENTGGIKRNTEDTQTTIEGIVKVDNQGNIKDVKNLGAETVTTTGDASIGGKLDVKGNTSLKNTKVDGTLETTGKATFDDDVDVKGSLKVDGTLDVGEISMKNDKLDSDGKQHNSATTITADGMSNNVKVTDKNGKVTESKFTHDETGSNNYAHEGDDSVKYFV